jgi:hypothetical protein
MVYEDSDGILHIYDWKRCKEIKKHSQFGKFAHREEIEHLPDTNYWHYALQLNIYKTIIEQKYDKKVGSLYLVCLHPDNNTNQYIRINVCHLDDEIKELFAFRKKQIEKKEL